MPRIRGLLPTTPIIDRKKLVSQSSNGYTTFVPQIRKLVFEYCEVWPSSASLRQYIHDRVEGLATQNSHVEFVVKHRPSKEPIVRGFYINNRDKVIGLKGLDPVQIQKKVQLLLDSSGAKIVPLKRKTVVSTAESARGIWSGLHAELYQI